LGSLNTPSVIRHPHPGDRAGVISVNGTLHHGSPFLIHRHLNAFSAASIMFLVALLSCNPVALMPKILPDVMTVLQSPCIQPQWANQQYLLHSSTK